MILIEADSDQMVKPSVAESGAVRISTDARPVLFSGMTRDGEQKIDRASEETVISR